VVAFFQQKRREGYLHTTIVGGEPYVRPQLLRRVAGIIPITWVVTSGTCPILPLARTTHFVSIDGASAETHDRVRNSRGLFDRVERNITNSRSNSGGPLFIHSVLNRLNQNEAEGIVDHWKNRSDGIVFSLMTPILDSGDAAIRLSKSERAFLVEELLRLKGIYGSAIVNTKSMIARLHPDATARLTPAKCGTARFAASFAANSDRIEQCILGGGANCTECGCAVTTLIDQLVSAPPNPGCFKTLVRMCV